MTWRALLPLLVVSLAASAAPPGSTGKFYRWVDENGVVHFTDTLPPDQSGRGHTELGGKGTPVRVVPPAKTAEELEREREIERLRAEQERLAEEQRAADRVLLRTYRSEDDILMARDGKMAAVDVMTQVVRSNIRSFQERLALLRGEAADFERAGKPIPRHLTDGIANTERAIGDSYATILDHERQKDAIRESHEKDRVRFLHLNDLADSRPRVEARDLYPLLHNLIRCADAAECDRLWAPATEYVRTHSTTSEQTWGDNILVTAPPRNDRDISLILSRIKDENGAATILFLDLQCRLSARGAETCGGERAREILEGFRGAVTGGAAPEQRSSVPVP